MATIIHNTTVLAARPATPAVLRDHSLVFEDGRITELRPAAELAERVRAAGADTLIAGQRYIVTPGLVNTHHHLYQSLTRCLPAAQDRRLFDWLRALYERWRRLDYEAVNLAAKISIAELLLSGCTTTSDHFYMLPPASGVRMEAVVDAARELGIRLHLCRGSMSLGHSRGGLPPDDCVEEDAAVLADCVRVIDAYHDAASHALLRVDLAPCSPFNVTPELLRDTRVLARERGVLLHTHLAETVEEEAFCLEKFGRRPVAYLEELDWLGPDVYLAHCVHVNDDEIALFARTGTSVSHNPTSNLRLGSGIAPLARLLEAGVAVGIGVDGASSNDGGNLLAAVKSALLSARIFERYVAGQPAQPLDTPLMPAATVFELATRGGARCLHRDELGCLAPGSAADIAMFRMDDVALAGAAAQDPLAALVLCDMPRAERVFVAGQEVVREGRIVALDEHALGAAFNDLVAARFSW